MSPHKRFLGDRSNGEPELLSQYCDDVYPTMEALPGLNLRRLEGVMVSRVRDATRRSALAVRPSRGPRTPRSRRGSVGGPPNLRRGPLTAPSFFRPPPGPGSTKKKRTGFREFFFLRKPRP